MSELIGYHYTTAAGLKGIIESGQLWATDARYLNDSREIAYAAETLLSRFLARYSLVRGQPAGSDPPGQTRDAVARRAQEAVYFIANYIDNSMANSPYIVSFCKDPDVLSQWRNHSGAAGYAIGFDLERIRSQYVPTPNLELRSVGHYAKSPDLRIQEVEYGLPSVDSEYDAMIDRIIDPVVPDEDFSDYPPLEASGETLEERRNGHLWFELRYNIWYELAKIKHESFREEQEIRLVLVEDSYSDTTPEVDVHLNDRLGLVPHIPIPIPRDEPNVLQYDDVIKSICVGPGADQRLQKNALERWLRLKGVSCGVGLSGSPYRA